MKRFVIALVVLIGLLVAADYGAAAIAESTVSRQMREQLDLADDPSVRINGFPFLTQALSGEYRSVEVTANRIRLGELQEVQVRAHLHGVQAPLGELLGSGPHTIQVRDAEGTLRIGPDDIEQYLPGVTKVRVENIDENALKDAVKDGGEPSLTAIDPEYAARLVGTVNVPLLGKRDVSVIAVLQLAGRQIQVVPRDIRIDDGTGERQPLPAAVQSRLQDLFALRVDPGTLPFDVTPTRLRARDGTLEISGTTSDLSFGAGATTAGK
ncbi:LmeA family phospholipid-binding protein [Pseudonocardia asaccharolytica]|uniref:DUF2993 domain-containing protein n=1 Tax=Pseudonocardia asaccharolytica DSM 44247 = NBRC 16224 TaxID=1123024 RepID=A0A511D087_9PSEU|nr:DUF2993 domain-containing protein [Pseudonocardia asaccharolytica]GEL18205.1 hypothetical protein PA7_20420 [Pseudonocardia asaccharolytica DSM 44247 = NBRC 16224]